MRKIAVSFLLIFLIFAIVCTSPVQAPTQVEIEAAIVNGVAWLANQQEAGGNWPGKFWGKIPTTALAVLKLEERAYELDYDSPFDPDYEYHENVTLGLNYLFSHLSTTNITLQDHRGGATGAVDNPDSNGNGLGVYADVFIHGNNYDVYCTGIVLAAISASRTPIKVAVGDPVNDWTYQQVAQDMVDWLAWAQSDEDYVGYGMGEGGWSYVAVSNSSYPEVDNSNSGYAVLGLEYAIRFGCVLPRWVKTELDAFIDDIQEDDGGSAYQRPGDGWKNILKTGNLIFEMKLVGDTPTTTRVENALKYLKAHWNDESRGNPPLQGWDGDPAEYQAMFCAMKGLQYMGIDTFHSIDWYADFSDRIVAQQCKVAGPDYGSWQKTSGFGNYSILITEWALLTLEKVPPPPDIHLDAEPPVLIDLADPVGTVWHELYPSHCNWHYLAGWFDSNNNSILDHCDYVILDNETGYSGWYHVDDVTVTLRLKIPDLNETMYVEFSGSIQEFPFNNPLYTTWYEVYPEYGNWFNLTSWSDTNPTGNLTSSDHIEMIPIPCGVNATEWHVDEVKTDLLVTFEKHPDFGDAPDPPYPSLLASNGVLHIDWNYEWLGQNVNGERDSKQVDLDQFDDGVAIAGSLVVGGNLQLTITVSTSGQPGRYNILDPNKVMYLNAWIDWNQDGDWADAGEKIIGTGTQAFAGPAAPVYNVPIPLSAEDGRTWLRFRLDYAEDVGANPQPWTDPSLNQEKGQAMYGEVEDYNITIEPRPEVPPVACFDMHPPSPQVCETVTFDASCSYDPDGVIVKYEWDWDGDCTYDFDAGSNPIATHHYDTHGTYSPKLRVTDNDGLTDETSITILVRGHPVADFTWAPTSPQVCETVTFDGSASTPDGGVIVSWDWDFGDTTGGSGEIVTHHYEMPGDHEVTLTVTDDEGKSDTVTKAIYIRAPFGGIAYPVDKFDLLAPYIGVASTILFATAATAIYAKRVKRKKENQ